MRLYLAGGEEWNAGAVEDEQAAVEALRGVGVEAISPIRHDSDEAKRMNLKALADADGVVLLPRWPGSPTSLLAVHVALALGIECWGLDQWLEREALT